MDMRRNVYMILFCLLTSVMGADCVRAQEKASEKNMEVPKVYMFTKISAENLVKIYEALGREATGKVAVKLSTGEPGGHNFLQPALIKDLVKKVNVSQTADFEKHLNQYDVIHLDIQWFLSNVSDPEQIVAYITECTLAELRTIYADQLPPEVSTVPDALSRIKEATGQKFVIIIDEWDVLIRDEASNQKIQDDYINFLRGMFKGTEPTKYIQLAFLTGILPIKKLKTQSALNNFHQYSMLNPGPLGHNNLD